MGVDCFGISTVDVEEVSVGKQSEQGKAGKVVLRGGRGSCYYLTLQIVRRRLEETTGLLCKESKCMQVLHPQPLRR